MRTHRNKYTRDKNYPDSIPELLNRCENYFTLYVKQPNGTKKVIYKRCYKCNPCIRQRIIKTYINLLEESRFSETPIIVKLTINEEHQNKLKNIITEINNRKPEEPEYKLDNDIATIALRRFNENCRKQIKTYPRHWMITDIENNEIILRGIIFDYDIKTLKDKWKYGNITIQLHSIKTTLYNIVQYIGKTTNEKYIEYKPKILTSKYIGEKELYNINEDQYLEIDL